MRPRALHDEVDNAPLVAFRILFGLVLCVEGFGAIAEGWVYRSLIAPARTVTAYGFEWLQPLPGPWMNVYYVVLALLGLMVMIGWWYRTAMALWVVMWTTLMLMQTTHYNNHHYLMLLLGVLLLVCPAQESLSVDARRNPGLRSDTCPRWCVLIFVVQVGVVYTYAAIAKMQWDWLEARQLSIWFSRKTSLPVLGWLYGEHWFQVTVAWGGVLFDLLITPMLLWRRTRVLAIVTSGVFHLFNGITFLVGTFPILAFGFAVLFIEPATTRRVLLRGRRAGATAARPRTAPRALVTTLVAAWVIVQVMMPLRHHVIQGDVNWTEEGHRMAWRMMLIAKQGRGEFEVRDPDAGTSWRVRPGDHLTPVQAGTALVRPVEMWKFAQYLKTYYAERGRPNIQVFARGQARLNGGPWQPLADPNVDLAAEPWRWFTHVPWIVPRVSTR